MMDHQKPRTAERNAEPDQKTEKIRNKKFARLDCRSDRAHHQPANSNREQGSARPQDRYLHLGGSLSKFFRASAGKSSGLACWLNCKARMETAIAQRSSGSACAA